eukprot:scaffold7558_cov109-Isochrysis_galbana.AAC.2
MSQTRHSPTAPVLRCYCYCAPAPRHALAAQVQYGRSQIPDSGPAAKCWQHHLRHHRSLIRWRGGDSGTTGQRAEC